MKTNKFLFYFLLATSLVSKVSFGMNNNNNFGRNNFNRDEKQEQISYLKSQVHPDYAIKYKNDDDMLLDLEEGTLKRVVISYFIKNNNIEGLLDRLKLRTDDINEVCKIVKQTPINYAIANERFEIVKLLFLYGAKFDNFDNNEKEKQLKEDEELAKKLQQEEDNNIGGNFARNNNNFNNDNFNNNNFENNNGIWPINYNESKNNQDRNNQKVKKPNYNNNDQGAQELKGCAICLCDIDPKDKEDKTIKLPCKHVFHEACINGWLNSFDEYSGKKHDTCPMCRASVNK